jgi:hypothetical protein
MQKRRMKLAAGTAAVLSRPVKLSSALFELPDNLSVYHNVPPAGFGNVLADSIKPWIVSTYPEMGQEIF